jgi:hypothetical protein
MKTSQELEVELAALGDSPEAVANALRAMGIKGKRRDACHCPLATYLQNISGEIIYVGDSVAGFDIINERISIQLPLACQRFINDFDSFGRFQDLLG